MRYRPAMSSGPSLSFVLLERAALPDPAALQSNAAAYGLRLQPGAVTEGVMQCEIDGLGDLMISLMPAPHPDAAHMPRGLLSPDEAELARMTAHFIVVAMGLPEDPRTHDTLLAKLTAIVAESSPAIAAMLGTGVTFHKAPAFVELVKEADGLPMLACVDVTMAPEPDARMSILTHGLDRYGREEFFVTASQRGQGAVDFILSLAQWMLADPNKHLPTGDTVGRTADEKIRVQRVPNPTGQGPQVIRLDLDR